MANYGEAVASVRTAFLKGKSRSIEWRISQLKAITRMLDENEQVFVDALKSDLNKPLQETILAEIDFIKNDIIGILRNIRKWTADQPVKKSLVTMMDKPYLHPEPYGVVLVIGAWNYPLQLSLSPMLPAIAAGNCGVIKPSEISPATADALAALIPKYLDPHCFKVITGGVPETTALLNERFDYIFYTGSTQVGKIISSVAAKTLTPCTLELGGKSPAYLDDCVNLENALKRLLWGKFNNSGQICVAPDYVLCTKEVEKKAVPLMKTILKSFFTDRPANSDSYCRVVSTRHMERLTKMLDSSKGNVVIGGDFDTESKYFAPTVVSGVDAEDSTMQEEIFGPILPILNVTGVEDAIKLVNSRDKPLAFYVYSERPEVINKLRDNTSSGGFTVNETILQLAVEELPFGGVGPSGQGAYHGKFGFDTFTHYKPVLEKDLGWLAEKIGEFRYPPYNVKNIPMVRTLIKNREMPGVGGLVRYLLAVIVGGVLGFSFAFIYMKEYN